MGTVAGMPPLPSPGSGAGDVNETIELEPIARSVGEARRFVQDVLERKGRGPWVDAAVLVVSELVTNAVIHARTQLEVRVVITAGPVVQVEVHDCSDLPPRTKNYSNRSGTGRGLLLVDALAANWGSRPACDGKVVWAEIAAEPGGSASGSLDAASHSSRDGVGDLVPAWSGAVSVGGPVERFGWTLRRRPQLL